MAERRYRQEQMPEEMKKEKNSQKRVDRDEENQVESGSVTNDRVSE